MKSGWHQAARVNSPRSRETPGLNGTAKGSEKPLLNQPTLHALAAMRMK